jgi:hypothetical protein
LGSLRSRERIFFGGTLTIENNYIELASDDSTLEWSYGNFSYVTFGDPIIKE